MFERSRCNQAAFNRIVSTDCDTVRSVPGNSFSLKNCSISAAFSSVAKFSVKYLTKRASKNPPCNAKIESSKVFDKHINGNRRLTSYCSSNLAELLLKNSQHISRPNGLTATEMMTKIESCALTSFCKMHGEIGMRLSVRCNETKMDLPRVQSQRPVSKCRHF